MSFVYHLYSIGYYSREYCARHPDSQLVRSEFGAIQDALTAGSTWNGANRGVHLTGVHPSTYNPMHGYMSSRYADSPDTQRYFDQDLLHRLQNGHPSAMYSLPSSGGLSHYPSNGSIPFLPYAMRNGQGLHDFDPRYSYAHPRAHQLAQIPAVEVLVVTTNDSELRAYCEYWCDSRFKTFSSPWRPDYRVARSCYGFITAKVGLLHIGLRAHGTNGLDLES